MDYVVKEKLFLEKALGMEFYDPVDRSLLYRGNSREHALAMFFMPRVVPRRWSLCLGSRVAFANTV